MVRMMLAMIAGIHPWIENPAKIAAAIFKMSALMINVNVPNVSMLIGKVKIIMIGRNIAFKKPIMIVAIMALPR